MRLRLRNAETIGEGWETIQCDWGIGVGRLSRIETLERSRIVGLEGQSPGMGECSRLLAAGSFLNLRFTSRQEEFHELCQSWNPDLVLVDLRQEGCDGCEVLAQTHAMMSDEDYLPILALGASLEAELQQRALLSGAADLLSLPCADVDLLFRVRNILRMRHSYRRMALRHRELEVKMQDRTRELERAQREVLERLALAAEYRDDDTGEHAKRVGEYSAQIAANLGISAIEVEVIRVAAPLHDLGKIGISDLILLKPGRLTPEEFETIKEHALIGSRVLAGSTSPLLAAAETIARSHHEHWDGSGYPNGLSGDDIPIYGRIVAVADVYDALTSARPYKSAMSHEAALEEICRLSGSQFDPRVVEAFVAAFAGAAPALREAA